MSAEANKALIRRWYHEMWNRWSEAVAEIEEMVADDERVAVRLTYTGTHRGEMYGIAATGRVIRYDGAAFFTIADGKVREGWVLGDVANLRRQLGEL